MAAILRAVDFGTERWIDAGGGPETARAVGDWLTAR
jgi:hypothetical protein